MHRLTFDQTVKITVSIDLNDEVAEKLKLHTDDINQFLADRRGKIVEAANKAAGREIVDLLQAYAEEMVGSRAQAEQILGPEEMAKAKKRYDEMFGKPNES